MATEKITLKDKNTGNTAYPYTSDELVKRTGGSNVKNALNSLENSVTAINTEISSLNSRLTAETTARQAADAGKIDKNGGVQDISSVNEPMTSGNTPISAHAMGLMKQYVDADKASKSYVNDRLNTQDQKINLLDGHEVVVVPDHTEVTNPDPQKIYREPGDDSYTDWMYQGSTWHEMAEYPVPLGSDAVFDENLNKTQEEVNEEVNRLDQEVNGVDLTLFPGSLKSDGAIVSSASAAQYRVWRVQGGDAIRYFGSTSIRFYVASDFTYNPTLPYTIVLATGETGPHTAVDAVTIYEITLPNDAKYIVINNIDPAVVTFEINGKSAFVPIADYEVTTREELNRRIWILVGQGTWQQIGKSDWKVGDRFYNYDSSEQTGYIAEVTEISGGGTGVQRFSRIYYVVTNGGLFIIDGHFYTYKGGEYLVRIDDITEIYTAIGTLSNLSTTEKTSIVGAVNEVVNTIGALSGLNTTNKSSVVSAINELVGKFIESSSEIQSVRSGKYWNTKDFVVGSDFTGNSKNLATQYSADIVSVQEGDVFKFYGIGSNAPALKTYVITDASDKVLVISSLETGADYRTTPYDIVIPENGAKLYVNFSASYDSTTYKLVKSVNNEISIPELDARISALETDVTELQKLPWYGKTIVCFGDSITEFSVTGKKRYSDYLADITGANVINVGVGGSRLQQRTTPVDVPTTQLQAGAALDIVNMVKASCEQVFTQQVAGVNWLYDNTGRDIRDVVTRLQSIDWSVVDAVTIFGGANDWTGNNGNTGTADSTDPDTTLGALNYMLHLLTYTYPKVRVFFFTPPVRGFDENLNGSNGAFTPSHTYEIGEDAFYNGILWRFTAQHTGVWSDADARRITQAELDAMSSDVQLRNGTTLLQFSRLLIPVAEQNHIPVCDIYKTLWNIYQFTSVCHADFTHPLNGMEQIAEKFYGFISTNRNFNM